MRKSNRVAQATVAAGLLIALGALAPAPNEVPATAGMVGLGRATYAAEGPIVNAETGDTAFVKAGTSDPQTNTYPTLEAAVDSLPDAGGSIRLLSDVESTGLGLSKDVNLDLNGHTISDTNPHVAFLSIHSNARLSISGGGTITSPHMHVIVVLGALTVRDATIVSTSGESTFAIFAGASGTVEIYGGLFSSPVRPSWCASGFAPRVAPRGDPGGPDTLYTVGEQVDKPTATNRVYNGTEQYGADASAAYVLSGGGTTSGSYTTTATPAEGYAWPADASADDGSYAQAKALSEGGAKSVELAWRMEPRSLEPSMVDAQGQTYDCTPKAPVAVSCDGHTLTEGTDYEVTYKNNVNAGTASYAISGKGNCTGNVEGTFAIAPADISQATFASIPSQTHTGKAITPSISGTFGEHALVPETDFTAAYADNTNVGTATVSITGTGNFTGTQKLTFNIVARDKETPRDMESGTAATSMPRTTSPSLSGASSTGTSLAKTTLAKTADVTDATYVLPSALGAAALAAYGIRSRRKDGFRGRR